MKLEQEANDEDSDDTAEAKGRRRHAAAAAQAASSDDAAYEGGQERGEEEQEQEEANGRQEDDRRRAGGGGGEALGRRGGDAEELLRSIMGELRAIKRSNTELKDDQRLMQAELERLRHENALLRQTSHRHHHLSPPPSSSSSSSPPTPTTPAAAAATSSAAGSGWVHKPMSGSGASDPADPAAPSRLSPSSSAGGGLDSASLPFVIKDALKPFAILKKVGNDGFFILANHAFCALYRYTLAELVGQSWRILIPAKEQIAIWTNFSPLLHDTDNPARVSDVLSMQAHHRTKEGVEFETVTHHQMFYDECGRPYWDVIYIDSYRFPSSPPPADPSPPHPSSLRSGQPPPPPPAPHHHHHHASRPV